MINFPPFRSTRLDVQLRELSVREAIDLAATPLDKHEAGLSAMLAMVVKEARGAHANPGRWTVQERMAVLCHYLACTSEGGGNFPVGDDAQLLDYLLPAVDYPGPAVEGLMAVGESWTVRQLTGDEAVALEGVCASETDWMFADMAGRLRSVGEPDSPDATDAPGAYADWLAERKTVFEAMPESEFWELRMAYMEGLGKLRHLFDLAFDDEGHLALPSGREVEGGGESLAPARFCMAAAVSRPARILGARSAGAGRLS